MNRCLILFNFKKYSSNADAAVCSYVNSLLVAFSNTFWRNQPLEDIHDADVAQNEMELDARQGLDPRLLRNDRIGFYPIAEQRQLDDVYWKLQEL